MYLLFFHEIIVNKTSAQYLPGMASSIYSFLFEKAHRSPLGFEDTHLKNEHYVNDCSYMTSRNKQNYRNKNKSTVIVV
jgi:hypothetical protein